MQIVNVLSTPVFLALLFLTYMVMWWFIKRYSINKERDKE